MSTAQSLAEIMKSKHSKYSPRPWNMYNPAKSLWWLVPSKRWPAYELGKFVFYEDKEFMRCGIHIEKGFGKDVLALDSAALKKGLIINSDWIWHKFMDDLISGAVNKSAKEVIKQINDGIYITIEAKTANKPSDCDPYLLKAESIEFILDNQELRMVKSEGINGILNLLKSARGIENIPEILGKIKELDWLWVDFYLTAAFHKADSSNVDNCEIIDGYELSTILELLEQWVKGDFS